jgi:hypothetical protein
MIPTMATFEGVRAALAIAPCYRVPAALLGESSPRRSAQIDNVAAGRQFTSMSLPVRAATLTLFLASCATPIRKSPAPGEADAATPPAIGEQTPDAARPPISSRPDSAAPPAPVDAASPGASSDAAAGTPPLTPPATPPPGAAVEVPATGAAAMTASLDSGEIYLLAASGAVDLGGTSVDAEYGFSGTVMGMDSVGADDVGIDTGVKALVLAGAGRNPPMVAGTRQKWFGAYRADHIYYQWVTGAGAPLALKLIKPAGANGSGSIKVTVTKLTPMPSLGEPVETVMVSFLTKTMIETSMTSTTMGKVYLLQANGESQVGGKGHNGDAEFDDYSATGTGSNEGEGGADFGICVNEPCSAKRALKWGPFRKDHDYFMLFAGTGSPIKFGYCDTGFGDNAGGMPVKIFVLP